MTGIFLSETLRCLVKGLAYVGWMYYVGGMIDLLGSYASSIVKAMLSCCVPPNELGKVYSLITFIECIAPFGVVQVYASVWKVYTRLQNSAYLLAFTLKEILYIFRQLVKLIQEHAFSFPQEFRLLRWPFPVIY